MPCFRPCTVMVRELNLIASTKTLKSALRRRIGLLSSRRYVMASLVNAFLLTWIPNQ